MLFFLQLKVQKKEPILVKKLSQIILIRVVTVRNINFVMGNKDEQAANEIKHSLPVHTVLNFKM